nr:uncharacterized protein C16orf46 homolog isoform X2 [Anolis sagrei ordinatus]
MTSSEQKQNTIDSERVTTNTRNAEIELRCTYPSERRERNQIYILLNISNSVNEQEEKSFDYINGTGWEDAERGWGRATPFACCKIPKKPRINKIVPRISHQKITSSLKKNMDWVNQLESKKQKNHRKFPKKETISSNQEIGVSSIKPYKMTTNSERERMRKNLNTIQTFLGEEKTLPIKEYEINSQEQTGPKAMRYDEINLPQVIPSNLSYISLNALLVFRQDEFGVINIHLETPFNNGATAAKRTKREDTTPDEMVSHRPATKKVKPKNRKKIGMNNVVEKSNTKIMYHPLICPQDSGILSFSEMCWVFSLA